MYPYLASGFGELVENHWRKLERALLCLGAWTGAVTAETGTSWLGVRTVPRGGVGVMHHG